MAANMNLNHVYEFCHVLVHETILKHDFKNGIRSSNLNHKMTKASSHTWFAFALHEKRVPTSRDFWFILGTCKLITRKYESLLWDGPHSSVDDTYFLCQSKSNSLEICNMYLIFFLFNIWWDFKSSGIERNSSDCTLLCFKGVLISLQNAK